MRLTDQQTADALHQQKEWLRTMLASIGDAVIAADTEGKVTFLNGVAQTLTGWKENEAKGQSLDVVFHILNEKSRQGVENPALRAMKEGVVVGLANHTVLISKTGEERLIDDSTAPIRDEQDRVSGAVLVFRDVSERRKAEASARLLASIVESSDDAIIGKDVNGIITSWNRAAERIFGYSAAEAVGQPIAMLAPPDRADEMPSILARIRRGEKVDHFDTVRRAKDGRFIPISLTVSPIKDEDGEIIGASKIARDISDRKRAEAALMEEKARLHATLTGIGDAVIVTDALGRITLLNPVAQTLTGWKEATGRPLEEVFHIINEDNRQPAENPVSRVLREGSVVGLANHTILVAKDGKEIVIDDSAAPVRDEQGRIDGVVLVFRDVTLRRRSERQLQDLTTALQESDRHKDEFLATLAHELRNPLAPIRNAIQILRMVGPPDPQREHLRDMIERQVSHLVRMVDDLLDVSRISRGKIELRSERLNMVTVVQSAVEISRPRIENGQHQLTVALPPTPLHVVGDMTRLAQIISNLLNNSAKYTPDGGRIWLTVEQEGDKAAVRVRDTGIGIPAAMLPKVFEMFMQVDSSLGRSPGGVGIGLTLVKRFAEMHGGTVEAHSEGEGKGSEFVIRLPLAGKAQERRWPEPPEPHHQGPARRILVVDDNKDSADSLGMMVQMMGHEVQTAYDGPSALVKAKAFRPDVVLLDIGMPGMSGYEVARRMRQMPELQGVVLVAQTGWGQEEDRRQSKEAGFDGHLVKPAEPDTVVRLLAVSRAK